MSNKLQIALIGCGGMASLIRERYLHDDNGELALLVDANEEIAKDASQQMGGIPWSTDFEQALSPKIDVVDISTPNFLHAPQAIAALRAGKHVLVQKPLATTVEECEAIAEAAAQTKKTAGMYMSYFDNPIYYEIKDIIQKGLLGEVVSIRCRGAHIGGLHADANSWRSKREKVGGGSFIQLALHPMNMSQWLIDATIDEVFAYSENLHCPNIDGDDITIVTCRYDNGVYGVLDSGYSSPEYSLEVYGTGGFIAFYNNNEIRMKTSGPYHGQYLHTAGDGKTMQATFDFLTPSSVALPKNPFNQHALFLQAVAKGEPAPIPVSIGCRDLKIVRAVHQSAKKHMPVRV